MNRKRTLLSGYLLLLVMALTTSVWALDSADLSPAGVTASFTSGCPVGAVIAWPGVTPPADWLECKGQTFNVGMHPELYSLLGTNRLPYLRGEFIRGWDHGRGTTDSGRTLLSTQGDAIRNIKGQFTLPTMGGSGGMFRGSSGAFTIGRNPNRSSGPAGYGGMTEKQNANFDASIMVPTASDNRPRNVAMMYIIKVK